ncbi:hypothetical protein D3C73_1512450 [compost metagenome]
MIRFLYKPIAKGIDLASHEQYPFTSKHRPEPWHLHEFPVNTSMAGECRSDSIVSKYHIGERTFEIIRCFNRHIPWGKHTNNISSLYRSGNVISELKIGETKSLLP